MGSGRRSARRPATGADARDQEPVLGGRRTRPGGRQPREGANRQPRRPAHQQRVAANSRQRRHTPDRRAQWGASRACAAKNPAGTARETQMPRNSPSRARPPLHKGAMKTSWATNAEPCVTRFGDGFCASPRAVIRCGFLHFGQSVFDGAQRVLNIDVLQRSRGISVMSQPHAAASPYPA